MSVTEEIGIKQWWPTDYCDEVMPHPRSAPDDWIVPMPGEPGAFAIESPLVGQGGAEPTNIAWKHTRLLEGTPLKFFYYEYLGPAEITVSPDGEFTVEKRPPPDASWFYEASAFSDAMVSGDTLEEFVRDYISDQKPNQSRVVALGCGYWSEEKVFSFDIQNGEPVLTEAGSA
ncbi:MAG: hypothetical protein GC190_19255 [Alphaproteobacteria bacterium]|nr:hypothetical protein [Alphaproteobacteria bacterium]